MMSAESIAIHKADRKFLGRAMGLGHAVYWTLCLLALGGMAIGAAGGWWAWHEAMTSAARTERYVVYLDNNSQPVGSAALGTADSLPLGVYLDFAKRWLRFLRSRPGDATTGKLQAQEVIKATDSRLYAQLRDSTEAANEIARTAPIDVLEVSVNLMAPITDNTATIAVRWKEQIRKPSSPVSNWSATLKVVYVPNPVPNEFGKNLLGLYAQLFQPTLES
jgi:type IV secretory pathway TrbF-like protein